MSVNFDSSAEYLKRTSSLMSVTGDYTVAFWYNPRSSTPSGGSYRLLWSLYQTDNDWTKAVYIASDADSNDLYFWTDPGDGGDGIAPSIPVSLDTFIHIAVTKSGNNHKFYINGVQQGSTVVKDMTAFGSPAVEYLGNAFDAVWSSLDVAQFREWSAALTSAELVTEMHSAVAVRTSSLFKDTPLGVYTDLTDTSGNGRDWTGFGTLSTGAAPFTPTRYYLTQRPPGDMSYVDVPKGGYTVNLADRRMNTPRYEQFLLSTSKTKGGLITFRQFDFSGVADLPPQNTPAGETGMFGRWLSPPLQAQTIAGSLQVTLPTYGEGGTPPAFRIYAYVLEGDTTNVRGVLLDFTDTPGWWSAFTGVTFNQLSAAQTLTPVTALAGDHIVVEVGVHWAYDAGYGATAGGILYFGTSNSSGVGFPDGAAGGTDPINNVGYIDFSGEITEQAPVVPANDACADAVTLTLPAHITPIDTTGSTDTNAAVWYKFTPAASGRYGAVAFGSTFDAFLTLYAGTCGALGTQVTNHGATNHLWLGNCQNVGLWDLTAGNEYILRVNSGSGSLLSGGYLKLYVFQTQAVAPGDVILNAQHFTAYRNGVLVNINPLWFGLTPTGSSVDYTNRPIIDENDSSVNTDDRLTVVLFGITNVEFFKLADLGNAHANELTFIDYTHDVSPGAPSNSHASSLVWDAAGNIYIGFFGDGYSVVGGAPSDPNTVKLRKLAGNITDSATSGPTGQLLAEYTVEVENEGIDYIDLAEDQKTIHYTSAGERVMRFDTVANTQLSDFGSVPLETGVPRPGLRGLRLLPPGDGSGGLLVTNGINVKRLNAAGVVTHTYTPTDATLQDLDKIELDPTGASFFWVTDQLRTHLVKFDLASGTQLGDFSLDLPTGQLCGFSNHNGYRAAGAPPPAVQPMLRIA